jgi:hypothetical protein
MCKEHLPRNRGRTDPNGDGKLDLVAVVMDDFARRYRQCGSTGTVCRKPKYDQRRQHSGTVTFLDGATQLGTGTLVSDKATFSAATLVRRSHSIKVTYGGDTIQSGRKRAPTLFHIFP